MKINFLLPHVGLYGGIKCTFQLCNELTKLGHQITILYPIIPSIPAGRWYNPYHQIRRLYLIFVNLKRHKNFTWMDVKSNLLRVWKFQNNSIPDADFSIVTWWENAFDLVKLAKTKGIKIHLVRSIETWGGPEKLVLKAYQQPIPKIVIAEFLKKFFIQNFHILPFGPIPDAIDLSLFKPRKNNNTRTNRDEQKNEDSKTKFRIGTIYSPLPIKGMADLIKAIAIVHNEAPLKEIELCLIGSKISKKDKNLLNQYSISYEHTLFPVNQELVSLYQSLDVYIMPSHREGFPAPPLEAMACGIPTILTDVGAVSEYSISGKNTFLIQPKNPEELAEKMIILINSEELREKFHKNGLETVSSLKNWSEIAQDFLEILIKLKIENSEEKNDF